MGYSFSKNYSAHTNEYIHDEDDEERVAEAWKPWKKERQKERKKKYLWGNLFMQKSWRLPIQ